MVYFSPLPNGVFNVHELVAVQFDRTIVLLVSSYTSYVDVNVISLEEPDSIGVKNAGIVVGVSPSREMNLPSASSYSVTISVDSVAGNIKATSA